MVLPALIGGGISLLGGLFGSKKKKEEVVNRVDYKRLVRDAEAAGFNPLTALRNGGAAGFSVTSQPVLSATHSAVGNAIGQFGNFISNFDPFEDKLREVQYRTQQAQLEGLQYDNAFKSRNLMFDVPSVSGRRAVAASPALATSTVLDGYTYRGTGEGGAIEDMWVAYRSPDGSYVRLPNPNLPDGEQMFIPTMAAAENAITRPIMSNLDNNGWVQSRPLTEKERRDIDDSWLPSWVPRIRYQR